MLTLSVCVCVCMFVFMRTGSIVVMQVVLQYYSSELIYCKNACV